MLSERETRDTTDEVRVLPRFNIGVEGSEAPPRPYVILLTGNNVGQIFKLEDGGTVIGRAPDADIILDDTSVSRYHACLRRTPDGRVHLTDLGSKNGTWVQERRIEEQILADGNRFQIGSRAVLRFGYQDRVEEAFIARLFESATRDSLTGLYNRRCFLEHLEREIAWHQRYEKPLSLILFDIDNFKAVNDAFGHLAGDFVLESLAQRWRRHCRTVDLLARFGGDEFACLLREADTDAGLVVAERLRASVEDCTLCYRRRNADTVISVTVSIGLATGSGAELTDGDTFLDEADQLLYRSKSLGRNRVSAGEWGLTGS